MPFRGSFFVLWIGSVSKRLGHPELSSKFLSSIPRNGGFFSWTKSLLPRQPAMHFMGTSTNCMLYFILCNFSGFNWLFELSNVVSSNRKIKNDLISNNEKETYATRPPRKATGAPPMRRIFLWHESRRETRGERSYTPLDVVVAVDINSDFSMPGLSMRMVAQHVATAPRPTRLPATATALLQFFLFFQHLLIILHLLRKRQVWPCAQRVGHLST